MPDDLAVVDVEVGRLQDAAPARPRSLAGRASPVRSMLRSAISEMASSSTIARPTILVTSSPRGRSLAQYSPTSLPLRSTVIRSEIS